MQLNRRNLLKLTAFSIPPIALLGYSGLYELDAVRLEFIRLKSKDKGLRGFRILQLSDLHVRGYTTREKLALNYASRIDYDILVVTGDFIGNPPDYESLELFLRQLCTGRDCYGVFGNWDYRLTAEIGGLKGLLEDSGIKMLMNESLSIKYRSTSFNLIGLDDPITGHADISRIQPETSGEKIVLAHAPDALDMVKDLGGDLLIVGHTHGGQINFPLIGPLYIPSKYGTKYSMGKYLIGNVVMYVNRGLGWSGVPFRFNCPPEVTLIEIV